MNRFEVSIEPIDIVAVEREARALRARAMAEMSGAAVAWIVARLRREPAGQTA